MFFFSFRKTSFKKIFFYFFIFFCGLMLIYKKTSMNDEKPQLINDKKCFVAIPTTLDALHQLSLAMYNTWVKESIQQGICDVYFFLRNKPTSNLNIADYENGKRIFFLDLNSESSNVEFFYSIWEKIHEKFGFQYEWFLMVSHESYVNNENLKSVLKKLSEDDLGGYVGLPGFGSKEMKKVLSLEVPYCLQTMFFVNKKLLDILGLNLKTCKSSAKTTFFDVEFGRCVHSYSLKKCSLTPIMMTNLFWKKSEDVIYDSNKHVLNKKGSFPKTPPSNLFSSLSIYPFSENNEVYLFHRQNKKYLRPSIENVKCFEKQNDFWCRDAIARYARTCVNNPSQQLEKNNLYRVECPSLPQQDIPNVDITTFILSLDNEEANKQFEKLATLLSHFGLSDVRRFIATNGKEMFKTRTKKLKVGEMGYIHTMKRIIETSKKEGLYRILILDDDALPHRDFTNQLRRLLKDERCGNHLWTREKGGVLLLGATVYIKGTYPIKWNKNYYGGWNMIDDDMKNASIISGKTSLCFNANKNTYGSFAGIYHRNVFDEILNWISIKNYSEPFDWIYGSLGHEGYIVRVAYPFLILPNVEHKSTTDPDRPNAGASKRSIIHRWKFSDHCSDVSECSN